MDYVTEVTGGRGGSAFLVMGKEKTALLDCGMAYCAPALIDNAKKILREKPLDYIMISHSHYDHSGAIPCLKQEWPAVKVLGAESAQRIFQRPNALKTIRSLGEQAAELYGDGVLPSYDDALLCVDRVVIDGDRVDLGNVRVQVLETSGHTQCSLAFLINGEILFASESTGYMTKAGNIYPSFIISGDAALASIRRCQHLNPRFIIAPHYGLVTEKDSRNYWERCRWAVEETQTFILRLAERGCTEEDILRQYEIQFRDDAARAEQPLQAFRINTTHMIKTVLRESGIS
ncbi:MAG TPA: MBL fold metallo-hydrolase [Patescibacteria group bacterium]|nr:MBL fold metallo-hydrolase [Patescibacteria group bacterium]